MSQTFTQPATAQEHDVVFDNIPAHPSDPNTPLSTGDIPPGASSTSFLVPVFSRTRAR